MGAAWGLAPGLGAQPAGRSLRYCIVGLGRISMQHFMPALRLSKYGRVTALVSGHRDKAEKMAAEYGVPAKSIYSYEDYDAIAGNPEIDAVYIALPNSMHAEYTIRAAQAAKLVLCEKPMATSAADAQAMVDACRAARRKLMIAYRCQFEPINLRAVGLIRSGKLGKVEAISTGFGFNIAAGEWRLNRKLAGGGPRVAAGSYSKEACRDRPREGRWGGEGRSKRALAGGAPLMAVGVYSLSGCGSRAGEEPVRVQAYSSVSDENGRFR